ncbi:unnamed protein product [Rhizopus stolonifer]
MKEKLDPNVKSRRASYSIESTRNKQAMQSIDEIIDDIQKLPSSWKSARRHSLPDKNQISKKIEHLDTIEEAPSENASKKQEKRNRSKSVPNVSREEKNHRKAIYPTYITIPEASKFIRQHVLFSGILRVSAFDSSDANVQCELLEAPIYIYGSRNRNRALDGDQVAVELVAVDDMLDEKQAKLKARQTRRASSGHPLQPFPKETEERPEYCGKVVCILERPKHMLFSGTLSLYRPLTTLPNVVPEKKQHGSPKIFWLVPINKRLPLVAVPIHHAPADFVKYHEEYKNRVFVGIIQRWPASSLHPFGTIEKEIGWMGELGVQSSALIADHHLKDSEFSETALKAINNFSSCLSTLDRKNRRNLQIEPIHIFTLGESEQDTEVAFSVTYLEKGTHEIGIHVTDVAHYVRLGTPLDKEARERSFVTHLVDKTLPILPPSFLESHCRFTETGTLLHTWVGRSIIKSKCHINPKTTTEEKTDIEKDAFNLLNLCRKLKQLRTEQGFSLINPTISYQLGESGYPEFTKTIELAEVDCLKSELLRIANIEIGQRITSKFPDQALLYRENPPKLTLFSSIQEYYKESCHSIHDLIKLIEKEVDPKRQQALKYIISQGLPKPEFYSAGSIDISKYQHFSLGAPIYTLFTEPLMNYASIIAQRQLTMVLQGGQQRDDQCDMVDKIARQCNSMSLAKRSAERESKRLYTAAFIYRQSLKNMKNKRVKSQSIVIGFEKDTLLLYFPEFDIELSAICNQDTMPGHDLNKGAYDTELKKMCLTWNNKKSFVQKVGFLSILWVYLHVDMQTTRPLFFVEIINNHEI